MGSANAGRPLTFQRVADAHGRSIAFPILAVFLLCVCTASLLPPLRRRFFSLPDWISGALIGTGTGLVAGGVESPDIWIDDPWFWAAVLLTALMVLRLLRKDPFDWIRKRRARKAKADRLK